MKNVAFGIISVCRWKLKLHILNVFVIVAYVHAVTTVTLRLESETTWPVSVTIGKIVNSCFQLFERPAFMFIC